MCLQFITSELLFFFVSITRFAHTSSRRNHYYVCNTTTSTTSIYHEAMRSMRRTDVSVFIKNVNTSTTKALDWQ